MVRSRRTKRSRRRRIDAGAARPLRVVHNRAEPLPEAPPNEWDVPVETLNLSVRSFNCLKRAGISKVSELLDLTEDEIMKMRNFGKKSLDEIKAVLAGRGLSLRLA